MTNDDPKIKIDVPVVFSEHSDLRFRRYKSLDIFFAVRHALLTEWDPLDIHSELACCDEYDEYAIELTSMINKLKDADAIELYLWHVASETIGFPTEKAKHGSKVVADRLVSIFYKKD